MFKIRALIFTESTALYPRTLLQLANKDNPFTYLASSDFRCKGTLLRYAACDVWWHQFSERAPAHATLDCPRFKTDAFKAGFKGLTKRVRVLLFILSPSAHCLLFSWRHRVTTMNEWLRIVISRPQAVWPLNALKIVPPVSSCSSQLLLESFSHSRPSHCLDFIFIRTDIVLLFEDEVYFFIVAAHYTLINI